MKLHEVVSRNEQLKSIFAQAVDMAYRTYKFAFAGASLEQVKSRLRAEMTKIEITQELEAMGVSNARDIAQVIISTGNALDK